MTDLGDLVRTATQCPSGHDPRFLLELVYELSRRALDAKGPGYNGCVVCRALLVLCGSQQPTAHVSIFDAKTAFKEACE